MPLVDSSSLTTYRVTVLEFGNWFAASGSALSSSYASSSRVSFSSSWASASISASTAGTLIWPNTTTASFSQNSVSSSWADRAGNSITSSQTAGTSSFAGFSKSASFAGTSSVAITASYVNFALGVPPTSSYSISSSWSDFSNSSSYSVSASNAVTASYVRPETAVGIIKAWAQIRWTGHYTDYNSITLVESYNIASVTYANIRQNSAGYSFFTKFGVKFLTPLSDTNYTMIGTGHRSGSAVSSGDTYPCDICCAISPAHAKTTTEFTMSAKTVEDGNYTSFYSAYNHNTAGTSIYYPTVTIIVI
jgi:hypothetical protein